MFHFFRKKREQKIALARNTLIEYVAKKFERIQVVSGNCVAHTYCGHITVHEAVKSKHDRIACVFIADANGCGMHVVNYDGNVYIDNTWGVWSQRSDYFFIGFIPAAEFFKVYNYMHNMGAEIGKAALPKHLYKYCIYTKMK